MAVGKMTVYWFNCDAEGCFESSDDAAPSIPEARANAIAEGFVFDGRRHYCPAHAPLAVPQFSVIANPVRLHNR